MTGTQPHSKLERPRANRHGADSPEPHVGPIHGARILYVDDDHLLRKAVRRILRRADAICLLAGTHREAAVLAASEPALTLAILDFHMPDGPVAGLLEQLRLARPALRFIGTSGEDRGSDFRDLGVPCFLAKPWHLPDLAHAAARVMESNPGFESTIPPRFSG